MKVSEVFEQAADAIETYGHNRGSLGDLEKGFCIVGAVGFATRDVDIRTYQTVIDQLVEHQGYDIADWADGAPTQEVVDKLRRLGKEQRLEEEGIR